MNSDVPQGSILGPLLFICYINHLPDLATHSSTFLYADDTTILVKGKDIVDIRYKLEKDLSQVDKWFSHNKLAMNESKTKCMLFSTNRCSFKDVPLDIKQPNGNTYVDQTNEYKYLGIWLDPHLTCNDHMNKICSKVKPCS